MNKNKEVKADGNNNNYNSNVKTGSHGTWLAKSRAKYSGLVH